MPDDRKPDDYRPISRRRRLLIVALAAAMAVTVMAMLLDPPGRTPRARAPFAPAPADCAPGQSHGCVGGKAEVIAPRRAASR